MAPRPRHPILGHAAQTTAYYPLKRGGIKPQFFGKIQLWVRIIKRIVKDKWYNYTVVSFQVLGGRYEVVYEKNRSK
ncbi:MAG: hypothetical protein F6K23_32545 [Okeania sp. SIO2C9]|uniref:hypothetical protein n=1 Tax=Okeania sp. SIO2C9 TaxID=2607791 RepID=UPI0013BEF910|nr:hypothetical protein [Okeania sp. SIO2C9]NEQ77324.1 hypothetical protein [Okeania sp. SIO2C9]